MRLSAKKLIVVFAVILIAGCTGEPVKDEQPTPDKPGGTSATTTPVSGIGYIDGVRIDDPSSPARVRVVYFEFDRSSIRAEFNAVITAHAKYLVANPNKKVSVEGHADERGTREYNIGLGERRSLSVRRLLLALGASDNQIATISYGEEKPAALGHDESAWRLNRRVEFVY